MYKRPTIEKPVKQSKLEEIYGMYGFVDSTHDPGWIYPHLVELMEDGAFGLHQFSKALETSKSLKMDGYKPEVVKARKEEMVLQGKRALMTFLKKHIEKYKSEVNAVGNEILRVTELTTPSDPTKAMLQEMKFMQIRANLKQIDPKKRREAVAGSIERLQALISNPDPLDVIIAPEALVEMRRDYAFQQDPSLQLKEADQKLIYKAVRQRAGDISATSAKMLINAKQDDPLPPAEFFDVFEPEDDYRRGIAKTRIKDWNEKQDAAERQKKLAEEEDQEGVNLEAGHRAVRINRGIPH